jgi:hypothetical protein
VDTACAARLSPQRLCREWDSGWNRLCRRKQRQEYGQWSASQLWQWPGRQRVHGRWRRSERHRRGERIGLPFRRQHYERWRKRLRRIRASVRREGPDVQRIR